jgi:hypothetical protein
MNQNVWRVTIIPNTLDRITEPDARSELFATQYNERNCCATCFFVDQKLQSWLPLLGLRMPKNITNPVRDKEQNKKSDTNA